MIAVRLECFSEILTELAQLFPLHWKELAIHQDKIPLSPQYPAYLVAEAQREMFVIVAREHSTIIGYYICFIKGGLHYQTTLTSSMDIMWVRPDRRQSGVGQLIFNAVETELRQRSARIWYSGSKVQSPIHAGMDKLLTRNGFSPVDLVYAKWIGA
jgi:GNAT superfamily N-acetyltransferase